MYRISMPKRIINELEICLKQKGITPIIQDDPPANKTLAVQGLDELKELGLCLKSFNEDVWG